MDNKEKIILEIKQFYREYKEELTKKMTNKATELSEKYNVDAMEVFFLVLSLQGSIDDEDKKE